MEYKQDNFFDKDIFLRLQSRRDDFNKGNYFTAILMTPVSLLYEAIRFPAKKFYDLIYPPPKKTPEQIYKDLEQELYKALANNNANTVRKILQKEPNLTSAGDCDRTPLMFTAEKGLEEMTALLLQADEGTEKNTQDMFGNTALHYAAQNSHEEIVALLLKNKADPNIENDHGETAQVSTHRSKPDNVEEGFTIRAEVESTSYKNLYPSTKPSDKKKQEGGSLAKSVEPSPAKKLETSSTENPTIRPQ